MICLENLIKIFLKFYKNLIQNAPKMVPSGVQTAFGVHLGVGNASKPQLNSKTPAIWDPKLVPKSTRKPSEIDLESDFETISLWRLILAQFLIDFRAVESKFLIQIESLDLQSERDIRQNRIL